MEPERNGDFNELKEEQLYMDRIARAYFVHITGHLSNNLGLNTLGTIYWREKTSTKTFQTPRRIVGKTLLSEGAEVANIILSDSYLKYSSPSIVRAGNSSKGLKDKLEKFVFSVDLSVGNNYSFEEISDSFKENQEFKKQGIEPVRGKFVDYTLVSLTDPVTERRLLIELGTIPIKKRGLIRESIFKLNLFGSGVEVLV
ncbi:MAG: hypothetical protein U9Q06_01200 [Nanoarchaeota archaeon]|nr:hypothetical protein [Nanoarchaeota archaeon]